MTLFAADLFWSATSILVWFWSCAAYWPPECRGYSYTLNTLLGFVDLTSWFFAWFFTMGLLF